MNDFAELGRGLSAPTPGMGADRFTIRGADGQDATISELRTGFKQGFVFEMLDSRTGPIMTHVMVLNPRSYTLSEPFQLTLTPGEDDEVVEESNGIIIREVVLEGTFGVSKKRAQGFLGAQGGGNPISGTEHFNSLRRLFRLYSARKKDPQYAATTKLIFHCLREDDHYVVSPRTFDTPRDAARTRVHYDYRITLAAIAEATVSGLQPDRQIDFADPLRDLNEAFNDARAAIAELTAGISRIKRKVGNIQAVIGNAIQIVNAVGGFIAGTSALIQYPLNLVATVADQLANAGERLITTVGDAAFSTVETITLSENARSIRRLEAAMDKFAMYDEKFQDQVERVEALFDGERRLTESDVRVNGAITTTSVPSAGGATVGSRTRVARGTSGREAGLDIPRGTALATVRVAATDTVESIASRASTTPEAIIVINDLRSPYITRDGGPGILKPGDTLLVPAGGPQLPSTGRGALDYLDGEEALYGIDIATDSLLFDQEGKLDIAVDVTGGAEDFAIVSGIPNVVQGLEITVNTERGTTVFIPELGLRRNVGGRGTMQEVLLSSIVLREAILSDTRVQSIQSTRVELVNDVLTQEITPVLIGQQTSARFVLPFGRASSGDV